jgi:acetyl-CoA acetyltransferase
MSGGQPGVAVLGEVLWPGHEADNLQFHDKTIGLETMCVRGGQGMAMIFERLG